MLIKRLFLFYLIALVGALAWKFRAPLFGSPDAQQTPAKEIVFDNGTLHQRVYDKVPEHEAKAILPGLKKCLKGNSVVYTNFSCPPHYKVADMRTDRFNVVDGQRSDNKAVHSDRPASPHAQKALQKALDLHPDERLKERMIDRAIGQATPQ
jgi:hypothetical protein